MSDVPVNDQQEQPSYVSVVASKIDQLRFQQILNIGELFFGCGSFDLAREIFYIHEKFLGNGVTLTELHVANIKLGSAEANTIAYLLESPVCRTLMKLNLKNCSLGIHLNAITRALMDARLSGMENVRLIDISENQLDAYSVGLLLFEISEWTKLQYVKVDNNLFGEITIKKMRELLPSMELPVVAKGYGFFFWAVIDYLATISALISAILGILGVAFNRQDLANYATIMASVVTIILAISNSAFRYYFTNLRGELDEKLLLQMAELDFNRFYSEISRKGFK